MLNDSKKSFICFFPRKLDASPHFHLLFVMFWLFLSLGFSSLQASERIHNLPSVYFQDDARNSGVPKAVEGSAILAKSVTSMESLIKNTSNEVLNLLYYPKDSASDINQKTHIDAYLVAKSDDLVAETYHKDARNSVINIGARFLARQYSERKDYQWIAWSMKGIMSHEITHVFQFGPRNSSEEDRFGLVEGMADYVRIQLGLHNAKRNLGGNWNDGYTTTGYFIKWLVDTRDSNFARKLNATARDYTTWSWDRACHAIAGRGIQDLWGQYQRHLHERYLTGDWDGDGRDNLAIRRGNHIFMDTNFDGKHDVEQVYGRGDSEDQYLVGDWDHDGRDNIAVRRGNIIYMDTDFDSDHDKKLAFGNGNSEDEYFVIKNIVTGVDTIGYRRGNRLYIARESDVGVVADETSFGKGNLEDQYLFGDWQGMGWDTLAVRRGNRIIMDYDLDGYHDFTQVYGKGSDEYLVGDWDGDGKDNLAIRRGNQIYMDTDFDGKHDIVQAYGRK
jgi:hypothetical protein